jgi:hypothetical protein
MGEQEVYIDLFGRCDRKFPIWVFASLIPRLL